MAEARFCDYLGLVGKCGIFVGYGEQSRCDRHRDKESKQPRSKIGKYSGFSKHQQENGNWQGFKRGNNG